MKINNKIQAFTLSEMMVAIVITLLVVGMAFSVLSLVQRHMNGISYNLNNSTRLDVLEQALWIDFNRFEKVQYKNDELLFKNEIDSITYRIQNEKIIRTIDTFDIQLQDFELLLDGKKVNSGFINAVKLVTGKESQNKILFIYKKNDATLYMN